MKDPPVHCGNEEALAAFGYPICEMDNALYMYLKNRVIRVELWHPKIIEDDFTEMSDEERNGFADMAKVAKALRKLYEPDKINFGAFGDTGHHCHFHLVPKYKGRRSLAVYLQ